MKVTLIGEDRSISLPDIKIFECESGSGTLTFTTAEPEQLKNELVGAFDFLRLDVRTIQNSEGAIRCYGSDLQQLTISCAQ